MPTVKGRAEVKRFIAEAPQQLVSKVLVGAARAAGNVVAEEARRRSISRVVSENITIKASSKDGRVVVRIGVKAGWPRSVGTWLEYGTSEHFISVDDSQRDGKTAGRINTLAKGGSLVIGGKFVGSTVLHPGARPHPFLRVSLDTKEREAIAAAQDHINAKVARMRKGALAAEGGAE